MITPNIAALLADPPRLKTFAAVALGAGDAAAIVERTALAPREVSAALRRLSAAGLIRSSPEGLTVALDVVRAAANSEPADEPGDTFPGEAPAAVAVLRLFVKGGRLVDFPAQWGRKVTVLAHVARRSFAPGVDYSEREVNDLLAPWCEPGAIDHVSVRRYLVDSGIVTREGGSYRLNTDAA